MKLPPFLKWMNESINWSSVSRTAPLPLKRNHPFFDGCISCFGFWKIVKVGRRMEIFQYLFQIIIFSCYDSQHFHKKCLFGKNLCWMKLFFEIFSYRWFDVKSFKIYTFTHRCKRKNEEWLCLSLNSLYFVNFFILAVLN